jgi:hypothetical protein
MRNETNVTILDLMRMTGMSAHSVEQAFREAEQQGFLRREEHRTGYRVTLTDPVSGLPIDIPPAKT